MGLRLWFPTTKGVAVIDPSRVAFDDIPPLAAIELVRANGSVLYDTGPHDDERPSGVSKADGLNGQGMSSNSQPSNLVHQLAPGSARVLEFHYTVNTFVAPEYARTSSQYSWCSGGPDSRNLLNSVAIFL